VYHRRKQPARCVVSSGPAQRPGHRCSVPGDADTRRHPPQTTPGAPNTYHSSVTDLSPRHPEHIRNDCGRRPQRSHRITRPSPSPADGDREGGSDRCPPPHHGPLPRHRPHPTAGPPTSNAFVRPRTGTRHGPPTGPWPPPAADADAQRNEAARTRPTLSDPPRKHTTPIHPYLTDCPHPYRNSDFRHHWSLLSRASNA